MEPEGYALIPDFLTASQLAELQLATRDLRPKAGMRNILRDLPAVADLARSPQVRAVVAKGFPVRGILFDKTLESNWKVPWHQDLAIAVRERRDVPGFANWTEKDGIPHVHPPRAILERMLTLRIHLDDCGPENGPLRVLPGSHRGEVPRDRAVTCCLPAGGALLMRPLLWHASSPATASGRRRVIHLEFAVEGLPGGLEWG